VFDTAIEQPVPLAVLAREITNRRGTRGINASTMWRWVQRGVKGQRLESVMIGGIRMSSREALARFFVATTAAADRTTEPRVGISLQRQQLIEQAERELSDPGI
jgi:Protein of unknown function (DUF1580)